MKQIVTNGIVLGRINYGEADRIITILTPDLGKLRMMVKGARRESSKLAGGIELFSVSQYSYIAGRGDLGTLVSSRMLEHYRHIVEKIDRTMFGYECLKIINRLTEDLPEPAYFELLKKTLEALDEPNLELTLIQYWLYLQLLSIAGHTPNLDHDAAGQKLLLEQRYQFSFDDMGFVADPNGRYLAAHIKLFRLGVGLQQPQPLGRVAAVDELLSENLRLVQLMVDHYLRR